MGLSKLNDKQREAVKHVDGPILVLAGAGSGKTRVLTQKVAYLINNIGINPHNVLAITFTNKAAKEMKKRIFSLIGNLAMGVQISTFHAFGYLLIRENYKLLGLDSNFTILDESDGITIIKGILKDINYDYKRYNPRAIKNDISGAKNELMDAKAYTKFVKTPWDELVVKIYNLYEKKLRNSNAVDFDDLLMLPIRLFEHNPDILEKYQLRYKYILIDEYQDTNEAQYKLSKLLSSKHKNICVVGDNDQAIYSFRGANYNNILNFEKDYPNAKVVLLEENYRSTKTILRAANDVISNNKSRKDKNLWTTNDEGPKIKYYQAYDEKDEASYVSFNVKKAHEAGIPYENIAILYRTNAQSRVLEESFIVNGIPYKVIGAHSFYNRKEIKDLIAYLRLIYSEKDDVSLLRSINTPKRGIGPKTIANLQDKADDEGKSIYEVINSGKELEFKNIIANLKLKSLESSLTDLVDHILEDSGMKQDLIKQKSIEADVRLENLDEFKSITRNFEEEYSFTSLEDFLMQISLVTNSDDVKNEGEMVSLMTMHAAKGLEFDIIFAVGLEDDIIPYNRIGDDQVDIEEERRLFYVTITRAKKQLYLLNAKQRMIFGKRNYKVQSPFIKEINEDNIEFLNQPQKEDKEVNIEDKFYDYEVHYKPGEIVYHTVFGEGIILDIDKDILSVSFPFPYQVKQILKNHKSLKKVSEVKNITNYAILVNRNNPLEYGYVPSNLVDALSKYKKNIQLEDETYCQWLALQKDVAGKGYTIEIESGYRSYEYQDKIMKEIIAEKGARYAKTAVALPGYSEHQTGLALDYCIMRDNLFVSENDIVECEESIYTNSIAHNYGFIVRYPKAKEQITGYKYEPWHLRYVGIDIATYLFVNNKTLDEYYKEERNEKN